MFTPGDRACSLGKESSQPVMRIYKTLFYFMWIDIPFLYLLAVL